MPITTEARQDFVEHIVPLSLWLAHRRTTREKLFGRILTEETPVYRLATLWDGEHHPARRQTDWWDGCWDALVEDLTRLSESARGRDDVALLEREGLALLMPYLEPRIATDVERWPRIPSGIGVDIEPEQVFGFFIYELPKKGSAADAVNLHMGNTLAPESPFADVPSRVREFLQMLDRVKDLRPDLEWIESGSWLNSFEPFLQFFPDEWRRSRSAPTGPTYTCGLWGQFITRTGAFHRRNGAFLRRTGEFPYPSVVCRCRIDTLRGHLAQIRGGPGV